MSLANSALLVAARNRIDGTSFEQIAERLPVLIGRDPAVATVVLPDQLKVSRVHASLELRGEELFVRDARSVNGTVVEGKVIPPETWVSLGRGDVPREFSISDWAFTVRCVQPRKAVTVALKSFGDDGGAPVLGLHATIASAALADAGLAPVVIRAPHPLESTTVAKADPSRVAGAYERYRLASKDLYELIVQELDATAPSARGATATSIAERHTMLADDAGFATLLRNYGASMGASPSAPPPSQQAREQVVLGHGATQPMARVAPLPPPAKVSFSQAPVTSPEQVALKAIQYLSTWYVGRAAVTIADIGSFTDQLRATLDELMRGHVPLLAGLDRFEEQLSLGDQDGGFELPRKPVEFARALLDWNDTSGAPARALRRSFADLMVHQVGMLNGIMRGVKVLLTELAPPTLERAWTVKNDRKAGLARLLGGWHKDRDLWRLFAERHSDLADEENETFRLLFGPEFVREYKLLAQEQAQSMRPHQLGGSRAGDSAINGPGTGFDGDRTFGLRR